MSDDTTKAERGRRWWVKVSIASLVAPVAMSIVAAIGLIMAIQNLDPAHALGISEAAAGALLVVLGGLLAGVVVGLISGVVRRRLMVPALAGAIVGVAVFLGPMALGVEGRGADWPFFDEHLWVVFAGQSGGIFLATSLTGLALSGAATAVALAGIALGFVLHPAPEPPAELFLLLTEQYVVEEATGECSGSGDFSGVAEGSKAFVVGMLVEESNPITLPPGREITINPDTENLLWNGSEGGCLFDFGIQDLGASEYGGTYLYPTALEYGVREKVSGQRVVFLFGEFADELGPPVGDDG